MLGNRLLLIAASILSQWIAFACPNHAEIKRPKPQELIDRRYLIELEKTGAFK